MTILTVVQAGHCKANLHPKNIYVLPFPTVNKYIFLKVELASNTHVGAGLARERVAGNCSRGSNRARLRSQEQLYRQQHICVPMKYSKRACSPEEGSIQLLTPSAPLIIYQ